MSDPLQQRNRALHCPSPPLPRFQILLAPYHIHRDHQSTRPDMHQHNPPPAQELTTPSYQIQERVGRVEAGLRRRCEGRVGIAPRHIRAVQSEDAVVERDTHEDALLDNVPLRAGHREIKWLFEIGSEGVRQRGVRFAETPVQAEDVVVCRIRVIDVDGIYKLSNDWCPNAQTSARHHFDKNFVRAKKGCTTRKEPHSLQT